MVFFDVPEDVAQHEHGHAGLENAEVEEALAVVDLRHVVYADVRLTAGTGSGLVVY